MNYLHLQNLSSGIIKLIDQTPFNEKNAIIDGTVANPSNPSVRLTAFVVATITKIQKTIA